MRPCRIRTTASRAVTGPMATVSGGRDRDRQSAAPAAVAVTSIPVRVTPITSRRCQRLSSRTLTSPWSSLRRVPCSQDAPLATATPETRSATGQGRKVTASTRAGRPSAVDQRALELGADQLGPAKPEEDPRRRHAGSEQQGEPREPDETPADGDDASEGAAEVGAVRSPVSDAPPCTRPSYKESRERRRVSLRNERRGPALGSARMRT